MEERTTNLKRFVDATITTLQKELPDVRAVQFDVPVRLVGDSVELQFVDSDEGRSYPTRIQFSVSIKPAGGHRTTFQQI